MNVQLDSFGIYVHIPFCVKKCPYCDFNSYAVGDNTGNQRAGILPSHQAYCRALTDELSFYGELPEWRERQCRSIFFGGGTPSLLSAKQIGDILSGVSNHFNIASDAEITLEANPGTINEQLGKIKLREYRSTGINRLSLGAQSFSERKLRFLGRIHAPQDTVTAVTHLRAAGFERYNIDLMCGTNGETTEEWLIDLHSVAALSPTHISAYGLTIEEGTEFGRRARRGDQLTAEEEQVATFYQLTQDELARKGYRQYEISNFAKPGHECKHNVVYWSRRDYLGIGAGAHSFVAKLRTDSPLRQVLKDHLKTPDIAHTKPIWGARWSNIPGPTHYTERIGIERNAVQLSEVMTRSQAQLEFIFLNLRNSNGINLNEYQALFNESFSERFGDVVNDPKLQHLFCLSTGNIALSKTGFLFSDLIFSRLAELS